MFGILILIDEFGSAVEYYLKQMVELVKCINAVESLKIKFEKGCVEKIEELTGKIVSRQSFN